MSACEHMFHLEIDIFWKIATIMAPFIFRYDFLRRGRAAREISLYIMIIRNKNIDTM